MAKQELILYHYPYSLYSVIVRLMLAEKNLKYESKIVDIYNNEQYSPQYMKLNPKGVVPTLVHNGIVVSNAIEIIQYIDSTFSIPTSPIDNIDYEKMMNWVRQMDEIPMEIIIFGKRLQAGGESGQIADSLHENRRIFIEEKLQSSPPPELRKFYEEKIQHLDNVHKKVHDTEYVNSLIEKYFEKGCMDALEEVLRKHEFIVGNSYTMADAVWTPVLLRLSEIGLGKVFFENGLRPSVEKYLQKVQQRPSFNEAVTQFSQYKNPNSTSNSSSEKSSLFTSKTRANERKTSSYLKISSTILALGIIVGITWKHFK